MVWKIHFRSPVRASNARTCPGSASLRVSDVSCTILPTMTVSPAIASGHGPAQESPVTTHLANTATIGTGTIHASWSPAGTGSGRINRSGHYRFLGPLLRTPSEILLPITRLPARQTTLVEAATGKACNQFSYHQSGSRSAISDGVCPPIVTAIYWRPSSM